MPVITSNDSQTGSSIDLSGGTTDISINELNTNGTATFNNHLYLPYVDGLIAHAGGGQGSATIVGLGVSRFDTVATTNDSAILPVAEIAGLQLVIYNNTPRNLAIFPPVGGVINTGSINASSILTPGAARLFVSRTTLNWISLPYNIGAFPLSSPGAGSASESFGASSTAVGPSSTVIGNGAMSNSSDSVVIGKSAQAADIATQGNVVIGATAETIGDFGIAIGNAAFAGNGAIQVALGFGTIASGDSVIAIGDSTSVSDSAGIGIGLGAIVDTGGDNSIAIGTTAYTSGSNAIAIGYGATASTGELRIGSSSGPVDNAKIAGTDLDIVEFDANPDVDMCGLFITFNDSGNIVVKQVKADIDTLGKRFLYIDT